METLVFGFGRREVFDVAFRRWVREDIEVAPVGGVEPSLREELSEQEASGRGGKKLACVVLFSSWSFA